MSNSFCNMIVYMMLYSMLGWMAEVCYHSIKNKKFENRGLLNLPFNISYGILAVVLTATLPSLDRNYILQYLLTLAVVTVIRNITDFFIENIGRFETYEYIDEESISNSIQYVSGFALAAVCLLIYVVVHPVVFGTVILLPDIIIKITAVVFLAIVSVDFFCTVYAMRTGNQDRSEDINESNKNRTQRLADSIIRRIWRRLEKSYPGITKVPQQKQGKYIFARGICIDKLIWVFLVSSFLGALIEMVYCYSIDGYWMNRSSLLYGPFSVVWGVGAVLLTISLRRFAAGKNRNLLKTFIAGFVIGGAYEYICSVFTEIVFGTVFWDYSNMPLNIGGRTNVIYCVFWGILAVVWTRLVYPPMSGRIEKLPPLWGKLITWAVMAVMLCNCLITACAMIRYTERQTTPVPDNIIEELVDKHFDDSFMETRWPNMVIIN